MKKIFALLAFMVVFGCGSYEIENPNTLYVYSGVYALYKSQESKVEVFTTLDNFNARGIGDCSWIDFSCDYPYVNVSVSENNEETDRKCFVEVYNDKYDLRDTFPVYQCGIPPSINGGGSGGGNGGYDGGYNETKRRCAARTKKGTRCKRTAAKGSIYCWQHKK